MRFKLRQTITPIALICIMFAPFTAKSDPVATEFAANVMQDWQIPKEPGHEEVEAYCGACHSLRIVIQQGLDRASWDELLVWMVEEQDMPELEHEERKLILDYLATHLGPDHRP